MNTAFIHEKRMWDIAMRGDSAAFLDIVSEETIMVCGGYRCTGVEYAKLVGDFGIASYEIDRFEIIYEDDTVVQVHYVVRTKADSPENSDLAGTFHVTSTWKKVENGRKLIFNMDSRITE